MRTGFDVVIAALMGADEVRFSTAPVIVMGCTMMRKCHLNTCPVGIATQDPVLRKKFEGTPEDVVNFFFMIAEDCRQIMASLGITKFQDLVGRTDLLVPYENNGNFKAKFLTFDAILKPALQMRPGVNVVGGSVPQDFKLGSRLEEKVIAQCMEVIEGKKANITMDLDIHNEERTFGATLSYHISMKYNEAGMPHDDAIVLNIKGSAGQSFGAFLQHGITLDLEGDANDYVGKGLSGGKIYVYPPKNSTFKSEDNVIIGTY